jgi:hypothetical protein
MEFCRRSTNLSGRSIEYQRKFVRPRKRTKDGEKGGEGCASARAKSCWIRSRRPGLFIDGEGVKDVSTETRLAGAAWRLAELYDMQPDTSRRANDLVGYAAGRLSR